ncbi:molybdenum ABC transporter ATP-binding protein [Rivibacter subsaxonicus]|uniref:Molybdate transport system ATP-binding protein n=1 Tax=Rivibacter subsaxonicus TaxID=457575 RepID=A0A4Q7VVQ3_9BURK|nr:molybdenum ABC transporter ATP-binding protein [Rivibacter subsaxonicus]RZU00762.1 molybdate transport system ATP-binding protein [Rivibacter subsaxonicus]
MTLEIDLQLARGEAVVQARFEVPAHGVTALVGRSGAGKSSVLLAAAGLLRPRSGRVALNGTALFDAARGIDLPPHARRLGLVFQDGRLLPHRSVRANLLYGAVRAPRDASGPELDEVVALLGIEPLLGRRPFQLSGGERQRVAIGRALLSRPRALLMDEPLASLDPPRRHELLGYLAALPARWQLPILYVTHQMDEVLRLADHVVLMSEHKVAAQGPALALLSDLSLGPLVGRFEAGAVLEGRVVEQLADWQLSVVQVAGQAVTVPMIEAPLGAAVRLRIRARDVALQRAVLPSSASNQLSGTVTRIVEREAPYAAVEIALGAATAPGECLWALVTRRSVQSLGLAPGQPAVASFKAVAVEGRATSLRP